MCQSQIESYRENTRMVAQMQSDLARGDPATVEKLGMSKEKAEKYLAVVSAQKKAQNGDYGAMYELVEKELKNNPQATDSGPTAIAAIALLADHQEDARQYVLRMQDDPKNYEKPENAAELALRDLVPPEITRTYWGAVSIAAFYQLTFAREDNALAHNALQLLFTLKNTDLDDAGNHIMQLKSTSAQENRYAQDLRREYANLSDLWVTARLHGRKISARDEAAAREAIEKTESHLDKLSSENASGHKQPGLKVEAVQNALEQNDTLVEFAETWFPQYHHGQKPPFNLKPKTMDLRYVAYVLRRGARIGGFDLGPAQEINREIEKYLALVRRPPAASSGEEQQKNAAIQAQSNQLYRKLWKPFLPMLPSTSVPHIYLALDSTLNLVPFDALRDDSGEYLIQHWNISYLISGRQLAETPMQRQSGTGIEVFADPMDSQNNQQVCTPGTAFASANATQKMTATKSQATRSASLSGKYEELPFARLEAASIARIFPSAEVCMGAAAAEKKLKTIHSPKLLHLATHGYYVDPEPYTGPMDVGHFLNKKAQYRFLRSGLILSEYGKPSAGEDGVLTSLEIALLDLRKTDLVVLSACDSGMGDTTPGDSMGGMRTAFHLAGAKALVSSLWSVNDEAGRQIMAQFYAELAGSSRKDTPAPDRGKTISEALRQAKLSWLTSHKGENSFYWAPFVLEGKDAVLFPHGDSN
jgi:CHAT domain-containing protein